MGNKLTYADIRKNYEKDHAKINIIYDQVIVADDTNFSGINEYEFVIKFLVEKYVQYDDFLHSNNLMQVYKSVCVKRNREFPIWYKYQYLNIYARRLPKFFLDSPELFWDLANEIRKAPEQEMGDITKSMFYCLLAYLINFYKGEYLIHPDQYRSSMQSFCKFYDSKYRKSFDPVIDAQMDELEALLQAKDDESILKVYDSLSSNNIKKIDEILAKNIDYTNTLKPSFAKRKIMIIGADQIARSNNKEEIYLIAESFGIQREQLEIYNDYDALTNLGERLSLKLRFNSIYCAVVFGAIPHSMSGRKDYSNIIARFKQELGFPKVFECRSYTASPELKMTKKNLINAFKNMVEYLNTLPDYD